MEGDSDSTPPASVIIEDSTAPTQKTVFSASVSTENIAFADPSLMMPVKGKMMKKQFFLGLLFPVLVAILFAIAIEPLSDREGNGGTFESNGEGEFSIDLAEMGWNCDDGSYYDANLNWYHEAYFRNANYDCDGDLRYYGSENIGIIYENGSLELDFLFPPVDGYNVEFNYLKDGVSRTAVLGQGDGVNTTFSGNVDPDYCEGDGYYEYSLNRPSQTSWFRASGGKASCIITEEGETIIDSKLEDGVLTFKLPDSSSGVKSINVEIYSYDDDMEFIFAFLPCLGCLGFVGVGIGTYMSGYKWFAYGVGTSIILVPAILFVVFIAALSAYGF